MAGMLEVEVAPPDLHLGLLRGPTLRRHQAQPHVVVLPAPAPEVGPEAVHRQHLLPREQHDAAKEVLQPAAASAANATASSLMHDRV